MLIFGKAQAIPAFHSLTHKITKMKKIVLYVALITAFGFLISSCSEDNLDSASVIVDSTNEENAFDLWLEENYRQPYNIGFKYKYEDVESDLSYDLVPAEMSHSKIMARLVKFLWLDAYSEAVSLSFMRTYAPRVVHVIGSAAWNVNGTYTLGTAEGGLKITLYLGNWLNNWFAINYHDPSDPSKGYTVSIDMDNLNFYYLHTIHHEFAHILHQTKNYPTEFNTISSGNYSPSGWNNRTDTQAAGLGFISAYAGSQPQEDFVELIAFYITLSDAQWQARLTPGGTEGAAIIEKKMSIVKSYMSGTWGINLDELKQILTRRYDELYFIDWVNF